MQKGERGRDGCPGPRRTVAESPFDELSDDDWAETRRILEQSVPFLPEETLRVLEKSVPAKAPTAERVKKEPTKVESGSQADWDSIPGDPANEDRMSHREADDERADDLPEDLPCCLPSFVNLFREDEREKPILAGVLDVANNVVPLHPDAESTLVDPPPSSPESRMSSPSTDDDDAHTYGPGRRALQRFGGYLRKSRVKQAFSLTYLSS